MSRISLKLGPLVLVAAILQGHLMEAKCALQPGVLRRVSVYPHWAFCKSSGSAEVRIQRSFSRIIAGKGITSLI